MGSGKKVGYINGIMRFLSGAGLLRFLLQKEGIDVEQGIVLVAEDEVVMTKFQKTYGKWEDVRLIRSLRENNLNFEVVVYRYKKTDKPDQIEKFLQREKGLPVLITLGVVPEFLRESSYILPLKSKDIHEGEKIAYVRFKKIVIQEKGLIQRLLTSRKYRSDTKTDMGNLQELYVFMLAVENIWCLYQELEGEFWGFIDSRYSAGIKKIKKRLIEMERFREDYEIGEAVKSVIFQYVEKHSVDFVERNVSLPNLKDKDFIVFDDEFYFIQETFLRKICQKLLETVSFLQLKREMYGEGLIISHNTQNRNYTVNKVCIDKVTGRSIRMRFVKIPKRFLISEEGLYLEELNPQETEEENSLIEMERADSNG